MKKLFLLTVIGSLGVFAISCGDDEAKIKNFVTFDGETYELSLSNSFIRDYGCDSECNYDFYLISEDEEVQVYLELYQLGGSAFEGGTFTEDGDDYFDGDDLDIGEFTYDAITGTVTATETSDGVWKLTFSYTTEDGPYNGSFEGELDILDFSGARFEKK